MGQVNIDDVPLLAHQEQIEVIPTFVLYKDGKAVSAIVAPESKAAIEEFLREGLK
jgi:thioredoxin-like negative regulator of GroEL